MREAVDLVGADKQALADPVEFMFWHEDSADGDYLLRALGDAKLTRVRDLGLVIDALKLLVRGSTRRGRTLVQGWDHIERTYSKEGIAPDRIAFYGAVIFARHGDKRRAEKHWKKMIHLAYDGTELTAFFRAAAHRVTLRLFGNTRKQARHVKAAHEFFKAALTNGCEALRPWYEAWRDQ